MPTVKQTRWVNMSVNRRFLTHWSIGYSHISVIVACSAQANYSKWSCKFYWPRRNKGIFVHISSRVLDPAKWHCSPQTIEYLQRISKNMRNFIKMIFLKIKILLLLRNCYSFFQYLEKRNFNKYKIKLGYLNFGTSTLESEHFKIKRISTA